MRSVRRYRNSRGGALSKSVKRRRSKGLRRRTRRRRVMRGGDKKKKKKKTKTVDACKWAPEGTGCYAKRSGGVLIPKRKTSEGDCFPVEETAEGPTASQASLSTEGIQWRTCDGRETYRKEIEI